MKKQKSEHDSDDLVLTGLTTSETHRAAWRALWEDDLAAPTADERRALGDAWNKRHEAWEDERQAERLRRPALHDELELTIANDVIAHMNRRALERLLSTPMTAADIADQHVAMAKLMGIGAVFALPDAPGLPDPNLAPGLPDESKRWRALAKTFSPAWETQWGARRPACPPDASGDPATSLESSETPETLTGATAGVGAEPTAATAASLRLLARLREITRPRTSEEREQQKTDQMIRQMERYNEEDRNRRSNERHKDFIATLRSDAAAYAAIDAAAPTATSNPPRSMLKLAYAFPIIDITGDPVCDACGDDPNEWPCVSCHRGSGE